MHRGQRLSFEIGSVGEEQLGGSRVSIVQVIAVGSIGDVESDDPLAVVERAADHVDLAVGDRPEVLEIRSDGIVQHFPMPAFEGRRSGLDGVGGGMQQDVVHVRARILID